MLLMGYLRVFVICSGPHCGGEVELVHSSAACCGAVHEDHDEADCLDLGSVDHSSPGLESSADECCGDEGDAHEERGDGPLLSAAHVGCSDAALSAAVGPLPKQVELILQALATRASLPRLALGSFVAGASRDSYGSRIEPPRNDQVESLLATTILRI